ncbi:hypothetical protein OUZ56_032835 [Daphnia magna]|uniref:Uncharacterized protein n=1 Tax=Daphnia magna TaxID=35525 RepID=A0ABR0B9Q2_9CRUS|nr:hypothetical protein OUZ56_032835 [Daphnia magna]
MFTYTGARSKTYSKLSENTAHSESEAPLLQQPIVNTDHAAPLVTPAMSQCKRPTRSTVSYKSLTITDIAEEHLASLNKRKPSRWQHIKATVSNSPSILAKTIDWIRRSPPPSDYSDTESEPALTSRGNKTSPTKPLPLCITSAPGAAAASYHSDVKVSPNIILDSSKSNHASPSSNDQTIRDQHDHRRTFSLEHSPIGTAINASRANQDTICRDLTPSSSRITIPPTEATGKTLISTPRKGFYQLSSGADHHLPVIDRNLTPPSSCSPIQPAEKIELSATIAEISSTQFDTTFPPVDRRPYSPLSSADDISISVRDSDWTSGRNYTTSRTSFSDIGHDELYAEGYSSESPTDEPSSESSSGEELPAHFDIDVDINTPGPTSDCESSVGTRRKRYRQQSYRATCKKLPNAIHQHPTNSANIISHTNHGINCSRHRSTAPSSGTLASNQNKHQPVKTSQKMNNNQQSHQSNNLPLGDLQDYQKGQRALTMLLQIPNFSGGLTARFDRWIKLFDNVVAISNWTDEDKINMPITKMTGAANEILQNLLDSYSRDYTEIKALLLERFHGNETTDFFQT